MHVHAFNGNPSWLGHCDSGNIFAAHRHVLSPVPTVPENKLLVPLTQIRMRPRKLWSHDFDPSLGDAQGGACVQAWETSFQNLFLWQCI